MIVLIVSRRGISQFHQKKHTHIQIPRYQKRVKQNIHTNRGVKKETPFAKHFNALKLTVVIFLFIILNFQGTVMRARVVVVVL